MQVCLKLRSTLQLGLLVALAIPLCAPAQTEPASRVWTNQKGQMIKATFVSATESAVVLQLENGSQSSIPVATLSTPDQLFIKSLSRKEGTEPVGATPRVSPSAAPAPVGPLTWPANVNINPKALVITEGAQKVEERKFHYQSGSFGFVSTAPLTPAVLREVASDFELVRAFFYQVPWGWQPRPEKGTHFLVHLAETDDDFIALGGNDSSAGGSKDDYIFSKFTALGLKKVGPRYAYDSREKNEGAVIGLTTRLLLGEMRSLTYPWSDLGLEEFVRTVAHHDGGLGFVGVESALKQRIQEQSTLGVELDSGRLITYLRTPKDALRTDVKQMRRQNYFDGMLLVYYFGYLDGDGRGTALHGYYRNIAQEALGWRAFRDTKGQTPRPRDRNSGSYDEWALEHLNKLLAGRTDAQLRADLVTKYRSLNVKFEK